MARVKVNVQIQMKEWNPDAIVNQVARQVAKGFDTTVGPHLLEVAKGRAPVSQDRDFHPQRTSKAWQRLRLAERSEGRFTSEEISRLRDLSGLTPRDLAAGITSGTIGSKDIKFFRGVGQNRNRTPDQIDVIRGGVRGAFKHQPGTLRDSHVYVPARRVGSKVVGTVRATAKYARPIHEGFTHRGGWSKKSGKSTRVKGRKWLKQALGNVRDDLRNSSTYEG